jgi:hypothetical protein
MIVLSTLLAYIMSEPAVSKGGSITIIVLDLSIEDSTFGRETSSGVIAKFAA